MCATLIDSCHRPVPMEDSLRGDTHFQWGTTFCSPHERVWSEGRRNKQPIPLRCQRILGLAPRVYRRGGAACLSTLPFLDWCLSDHTQPRELFKIISADVNGLCKMLLNSGSTTHVHGGLLQCYNVALLCSKL